MDLKVGMYCLIEWGTKEQEIVKCTAINEMANNDFYIYTENDGYIIYKSMILKSSFDIKDLEIKMPKD